MNFKLFFQSLTTNYLKVCLLKPYRRRPLVCSKQLLMIASFCMLMICVRSDLCISVPLTSKDQSCNICEHNSYFVNCTHTYPSNKYIALSDSDCAAQCCNQTTPTFASKISICSASTDSSSRDSNTTNIAVILLIVFFSLPAAVCLYIIISNCWKRRREGTDMRRDPASDSQPNQPTQPQISLSDFDMNSIGPYYMQNNQTCSICLDDHCDIITRCGHAYHVECLKIWMKKARKCPLCVSTELNPIIYYCSACYKSVKLAIISRSNAEQGNQRVVLCNACKSESQRENCDEVSINLQSQGAEKNHEEHVGQLPELQRVDSSNNIIRN